MTQSRFRPIRHLKMTVRTSVLWKIFTHMAKKWPGMVVQRTFIKGHSFVYRLLLWHQWEPLVYRYTGKSKFRTEKLKHQKNWPLFNFIFGFSFPSKNFAREAGGKTILQEFSKWRFHKIFGPICVPVLLTMRIAFGSADSGCSTRFMEMENAYKINCMFSIISRLLQSLFPVV